MSIHIHRHQHDGKLRMLKKISGDEQKQQKTPHGKYYVSEVATVNRPSMNTLAPNIRATRQERDLPTNPMNLQAIATLPNNYRVTSTEDQFLAYDGGVGDPNRIMIFASAQGIRLLGSSSQWSADGTFKVCPSLSFQLYPVHAHEDERIMLYRTIQYDGNGPDDVLIECGKCTFESKSELRCKGQFLPSLLVCLETHSRSWSRRPLFG